MRSLQPPSEGHRWECKVSDLPKGGTAEAIVNRLKEELDYEFHPEAYVRVDHRPKGYKWHTDVGHNYSQPWCQYGCSILLSRDYEYVGAMFHYRDSEIQPEYCGLLWHTSDEEHMVDSHQGVRVTMLVFC